MFEKYYFFCWEHISKFGKGTYSDVCKEHPFIAANKARERLDGNITILSYKEITEFEYNLFGENLKEQLKLQEQDKLRMKEIFEEFQKEPHGIY